MRQILLPLTHLLGELVLQCRDLKHDSSVQWKLNQLPSTWNLHLLPSPKTKSVIPDILLQCDRHATHFDYSHTLLSDQVFLIYLLCDRSSISPLAVSSLLTCSSNILLTVDKLNSSFLLFTLPFIPLYPPVLQAFINLYIYAHLLSNPRSLFIFIPICSSNLFLRCATTPPHPSFHHSFPLPTCSSSPFTLCLCALSLDSSDLSAWSCADLSLSVSISVSLRWRVVRSINLKVNS